MDVRSLANPLVAGDFGLRFYAGVPLRTTDGYNLGTLCVIDREPRSTKADYALAKQTLLAREIDHRVMNSLQFVSALLRLQPSAPQLPTPAASWSWPPTASQRSPACIET